MKYSRIIYEKTFMTFNIQMFLDITLESIYTLPYSNTTLAKFINQNRKLDALMEVILNPSKENIKFYTTHANFKHEPNEVYDTLAEKQLAFNLEVCRFLICLEPFYLMAYLDTCTDFLEFLDSKMDSWDCSDNVACTVCNILYDRLRETGVERYTLEFVIDPEWVYYSCGFYHEYGIIEESNYQARLNMLKMIGMKPKYRYSYVYNHLADILYNDADDDDNLALDYLIPHLDAKALDRLVGSLHHYYHHEHHNHTGIKVSYNIHVRRLREAKVSHPFLKYLKEL